MSGSESLPRSNDVPVWRRVLSSPVSDLVRGRVGVATSVSSLITAAALPQSLGQLVSQTVQATRLWHRERLDVARELISHFQDGLEAGITSDDLARRFGDPKQAAPLIRRARIRCRSLAWHAWRWSFRSAAALMAIFVVVYGGLAVRYAMGKPVLAHDYLSEWNERAKAIPEADRAWPFYAKAIVEYQPPKDLRGEARWMDPDTDFRPSEPDWPKLEAHVKNNQAIVALIRQGAERPRFGFRYNDPDDTAFVKKATGSKTPIPDTGTPLWEVVLPQNQESRTLSRLLTANIRIALHEKNGDSIRQDLTALIALAEHQRETNVAIAELVSFAIYAAAIADCSMVLEQQPDLLTSEDWTKLAHRFASWHEGGTIRPELGGERKLFDDLLQRVFSDDGDGDGRLTPEGLETLASLSSIWETYSGEPRKPGVEPAQALRYLIGPASMALVAGRREQRELARSLIDQSELENRGPLHTWPESSCDNKLRELSASPTDRIRYSPVLSLLPAIQQLALAGERITQQRDGLLTGIALELYRRDHGDWPASLEPLVPRYLPELPLDRFTGKPLSYTIRDGKPLVYAWGMDGQDDGGRASTENRGQHFYSDVMSKPAKPRKPGEGYDWPLFPRTRFAPEPIEEENAKP
jgi:hypothetical protein